MTRPLSNVSMYPRAWKRFQSIEGSHAVVNSNSILAFTFTKRWSALGLALSSVYNVADPTKLTKTVFNGFNSPRWKLCRRSNVKQLVHILRELTLHILQFIQKVPQSKANARSQLAQLSTALRDLLFSTFLILFRYVCLHTYHIFHYLSMSIPTSVNSHSPCSQAFHDSQETGYKVA